MKTITFIPPAAELLPLVGTRRLPDRGRLLPIAELGMPRVGDIRWAWAFGRLRRGRVIKVGRSRVTVAYVAPSRPDLARKVTVDASYCYPDRRVAESGCH